MHKKISTNRCVGIFYFNKQQSIFGINDKLVWQISLIKGVQDGKKSYIRC